MPERRPDVALHRGVGEVPLQPRLHQRRRQHVEQRVGHLEVGLGVLEPDRVHLVRHRRRADGPLAAHLREVPERDVRPQVGAEVVHHPVEPRQVRIQLGLPVVALDLRRERVPREPEPLDERPADPGPVRVGHRGEVRPERAGGAVELAEVLGVADPAQLPSQPRREDGQLLAERRRRRGLPMGMREHRYAAQLAGHLGDLVDDRSRAGQPDLLDRALDHQRVREVVDVLGGAGEVHELAEPAVLVGRDDRGETVLEEVLDRFDVVDRLPLDGGELVHLRRPELRHDAAQGRLLVVGEVPHTRHDLVVGQVDEPLHLDTDPHPVEGGLGEEVDQRRHDRAVPAVERTEGHRRVGVRERGHGSMLPEPHRASCRRLSAAGSVPAGS